MEIKFNVTGARRKELVETAGGLLGWAPVYKGAPSFAYVVANVTISKDGALSFDERTDVETARRLLEGLHAAGFVSDDPETGMPYDIDEVMADFRRGLAEMYIPELAPRRNPDHDYYAEGPSERDVPDSLTIEFPLEGFTELALENLYRLIASKAALIKKAIGADALPVERTETTLRFPWFRFGIEPEEVNAYSRFIGALCAAAKEQHRVTAKEKPVENEKFAFRVFLIRLGFVGDDYKTVRKILLRNLSGNSAFKNGAPPKTTEVGTDE
jgi:hypothetical protein